MSAKKLLLLPALIAFSSVHAGTISTASPAYGGAIGEVLTVSLFGDFSDQATIGGGFDLFFDSSQLGFISFGFSDAASFADDPSLRRAPDLLDGELNGIGFGNFDGLGGIFELATIQFLVLSTGQSFISMAVNEGGPPSNPGSFFDLDGQPLTVTFSGSSVATVPLPATFLLLLSACSFLLKIRINHEARK